MSFSKENKVNIEKEKLKELKWIKRDSTLHWFKFLPFFIIGWDDRIKKKVNHLSCIERKSSVDICYIIQNALFVSRL
jgi:hypothetical protein